MILTVSKGSEIDTHVRVIKEAARQAAAQLRDICGLRPMELFWRVKFEKIGFHPVEPRRINLVEQVNQTWSYLAALEAARVLLTKHPTAGAMRLAPGAHAAQELDVMSEDGEVVAEVFAAVLPANNNKLNLDMAKLIARPQYLHRYIFFMSPGYSTEKLPDRTPGVEIWSLAKPTWPE